ncbi:MAG TPA: tRNA (adenosine(37)-N6)-threonylcarbamoyltransferase complex transferase subunit TsaD, partial [Candidatus Portnoybacteria bacterium]|nr:tRNA (adenosine(37)-N6)-threonylcarbamoyltransferase complex transferase subunit TsaD [Candidatus Portnoybacteria bacterium]
DFSFSGLKTAVLYTLQKMTKAKIKQLTPAIAAEFQQAVIDVLTT